MERITISLDEALAKNFDALIQARGYANRSEAVRDMLRRELEAERLATDAAPYCVASLSYVYNHHERRLAERLTELQHRAHGLVVSAMHVHLDHEHCMETLFLRGPTQEIRRFADAMAAERGVRHSALNLVTVDADSTDPHHHGHCRPLG
ncbi:nickel-responsive transcriptional regulator NikR [Methylomagnum ishizawai]|uniref:nickel-responsive transcriptional regulator NikR n=1 Tax=Methylomagnum ishizawai TaxID=1760988 RepID=UPI001C323D9E|nr:nickel-responsive transcriptional regulator NikR [Methylomagnum ishizawai]BBL73948.1 putative nickel-responsive regulator [Methylomagnum ishizawai]